MTNFKRLRGTHDIYGDDARLFQKAEAEAGRTFKLFGFSRMRTPVMEEKELFTRALGTETDVIQKEMYEFEDRSKTRVALRPEGTAGVVRAYLENNFDKNEGLSKFYYIGPMFRSERPQAGRLRQFHQIGVEQLGTSSPYADVETIQALTVFLDNAGAGGYKVKLNNLGTFEERIRFKEKLKEFFLPKKNLLCEDCRHRFERNILRILDCKVENCRALVKESPSIREFLTEDSQSHYAKVLEGLAAAGISFTEDPHMVRGLDYYTKTVFEITHPKLGAQDALAAGGRYDSLIESFGGPKVGAVGFAIGIERLLMCLDENAGKLEGFCPSVFVATLGEAAFKEGFKILSELRRNGVKAAMDFEAKSLKSQLRSADKNKNRYVAILGDDELKKNVLMLKDMQDGSQSEVSLKNIPETLKKKVELC